MRAVREGDLAEAVRITRLDNPLPAVLGRVCDHLCEHTCIRTHLDEPLAIRQMKRFVMDHEADDAAAPARAGPGRARGWPSSGPDRPGWPPPNGWPAPASRVTILEEHPYAGGMVGGAIPAYRLPQAQIEQDLAVLARLGVEIRYGVRAGRDVTVAGLRAEGFAAVVVTVGAQRAKRLGLPGEDAAGVIDGVTFLRSVREGAPVAIGARVGVVGRRRHGDGLRPDGAARRGGDRAAHLPPHDRPDAGRSRGGPRPARGGHRGRRAGPPGRTPGGGRRPGRASSASAPSTAATATPPAARSPTTCPAPRWSWTSTR